jgi:hypothetical protein
MDSSLSDLNSNAISLEAPIYGYEAPFPLRRMDERSCADFASSHPQG